MAATSGSSDHKHASAVRPGISNLQQPTGTSSSPHTPSRAISSTFSSPAYGYRSEPEILVFEFGARYIRAGIAGESAPRCKLGFGPEQARRVGDYRQWLPGYESRPKKKETGRTWGKGHELWHLDLREMDLGLFEDKIERLVRDIYTRYLLLDAKTKRVVLVLPSLLPHPLLSSLISCLFNNCQMPSITMLPSPTMAVVSAGLRSAVVVDIGWHETNITAVYEYREISQRKTTRAMSLVTDHMKRMLQNVFDDTENEHTRYVAEEAALDRTIDVEFSHAEEVTARLAWCRTSKDDTGGIEERLESVKLGHQIPDKNSLSTSKADQGSVVSVPLLSSSSKPVQLPFSAFQQPVEAALLASDAAVYVLDDEEQPIPHLLYKALLSLPPDVRGLCMARIIITGGGSEIPGLKSRIVNELSTMVRKRGWDPVCGKAADKYRHTKAENARNQSIAAPKLNMPLESIEEDPGDLATKTSSLAPAAFEPQVSDPIEEKLRRRGLKVDPATYSGVVRGVETLGAWAGASLVAGMKIKGVVEIERDAFLQHGLAGAKREMEVSVAQTRQSSFGQGLQRGGGAEKAGWTLGVWA
ncbi:hypothetical protein MMC13_002360 [Lambiella insularis]|nr:hypothetical protein [Lambiella insularis]